MIKKQLQKQKGFSVLKLMIVVAVTEIIATIASPAYSKMVKKAQFSEVMMAVGDLKTWIEICYQVEND